MKTRCLWPGNDELMIEYHDTEWGTPLHDDRKLFEFLVLDAFQAGLSWSIILKKRESFRQAFDNFDPVKIAKYGQKKITGLIADPGIIRNRLKIESTVVNAKMFLDLVREFGSFDKFIWGFVDGRPIVNKWKSHADVNPTSPESDAMSKELKQRGFKFAGSTICYAFMQAAGMVNDHLVTCFRYREVGNKRSRPQGLDAGQI